MATKYKQRLKRKIVRSRRIHQASLKHQRKVISEMIEADILKAIFNNDKIPYSDDAPDWFEQRVVESAKRTDQYIVLPGKIHYVTISGTFTIK